MSLPRPLVYVAISGHGFGHATRTAAVLDTLQKRCPEVLLAVVTSAPRWLLESYIDGEFLYRPRALDVGVIQADSLHLDLGATLDRLQALRAQANQTIAAEVAFIRQLSVKNVRAALVLADLPPLAIEIAQAAGLPCWALGNFGWDFIYRDWLARDAAALAAIDPQADPALIAGFEPIVDWMVECWGRCDRLFRLPMHEPMKDFPHRTDVGLTGGEPRYAASELRDRLGLPPVPPERTVLLTFGGLGLQQIPYDRLAEFPDWSFITFDRHAPTHLPNLCVVRDPVDGNLTMPAYRPVDFMPLCGRIVSKPGYSTFAEAVRLGIPLVTLERSGFAEAPLLVSWLGDRHPHQVLKPEQFFSGDWNWLRQPLRLPDSSERFALGGNAAVAGAIAEFLRSERS